MDNLLDFKNSDLRTKLFDLQFLRSQGVYPI